MKFEQKTEKNVVDHVLSKELSSPLQEKQKEKSLVVVVNNDWSRLPQYIDLQVLSKGYEGDVPLNGNNLPYK